VVLGQKQLQAGFRALLTASVSVRMTMPSATSVAQASMVERAPSTSTRQSRQEPKGRNRSSWQRVGMETPFSRQAWRIVWPGLA